MSADEQSQNNEPANAESERPGALLKAAREQSKLSEEDVARELRMTVTKVQALEADDYDKLHSDTFIRGYLRTYAKLLNLDPDAILEAYREARREAGLGDEPEESPLQINVPAPARSMGKFIIWILVLLMGIWALSVWFLGNRQDAAEPAPVMEPVSEVQAPATTVTPDSTTPEPTEASAPTSQLGEAEGTPAIQESPDASPIVSAPGAQAQALVAAEASRETASTAANLQQPTDGAENADFDELSLSFAEECWVEVTDSRGDVLETDLLQPGRTLALQGEAPFTVKLGNAAGVTIELNGEPFEFDRPVSGRYKAVTVN